MLRTRLLTATAALALFAAGPSLAQTAPVPGGEARTTTGQTVMPSAETAPATAEADVVVAVAANTVVDVLRANGQFTTLLAALDAAQLTETLNTQPAISIFAPTDAAFAALPEADRTRLLDPANVNELRQLLLYHVIVADVNSSQIEGALGGVETAASTQVQLDGTGDAIKVDAATVTTADLDAANGAVFIIDRVLNPAASLVATGDADEASAPVDAAVEGETPPVADDSVTGDDMEGSPAAPASTATTAPATSTTGTVNAPDGRPAASVTTTASPPVPNPTDGQVDDEDETDTPAPTPQS